jgi:sulfur-oxidizing protein SoxX
MKKLSAFAALALLALPASAQQIDTARLDAAVAAAFPTANETFKPRLMPDETLAQCSAADNSPAEPISEAIEKRERAAIQYPADGKFVGDWQKGERIAQSGYGMRFSDYPARNPNGGNCYGCHELTVKEVSFGTVGPTLREYGKLREFKEQAAKEVYEKIYNAQAVFPCSLMPRFGHNKVLTIEQIKDIVALLMSPDSPVNK